MRSRDYTQAEALIVDSQRNTLRLMRDILVGMGFKQVDTMADYRGLKGHLGRAVPDLLILDAEDHDSDAFEAVRHLRNDPTVINPFTCILVTTWQPTGLVAARTINSGADALLIKPAAPRQVMDRIISLIENRKKFVVTADYVGPDRRKDPRPGLQIPLVDVPNSLRLKAYGEWEKDNGAGQVISAMERVNDMRVVRLGFQVSFLIEYAIPGLGLNPPAKMALEHIERLPGIMNELTRRLPERLQGEQTDKVLGTLRTAITQLDRVFRSRDRTPHLEQLSRLGLAVMEVVQPRRAPEGMAKEVAEAVATYRKRLEEIVAAKIAAAEAGAGAGVGVTAPGATGVGATSGVSGAVSGAGSVPVPGGVAPAAAAAITPAPANAER